jgi:hypothetical protein
VHAADTNTLKFTNFFNTVTDTHAVMAAGSSPSIADFGLIGSTTSAVFAGSDNLLRVLDVSHNVLSLVGSGLAVAPGTTPVIASGGGGFAYAFHGSATTTLWWVDTFGRPQNTGLAMATGSSPAISWLMDGSDNFRIAFVRATGFPAVYDTASGTTRDFPTEAVADNSSPAIATIANTPGGGEEIAFVGRDDHALWRALTTTGSTASTHIPVTAGTSPSIAFISGAYQVLVNSTTGTIWQYLGDGNQRDTHRPIAAGSSPTSSNWTQNPATPTPL